MSYVPFTDLPPTAKTWVFGANAPLDDGRARLIRSELESFVRDWSAHGSDLPASFDLLRRRFIVVAADDAAQPGGCSVDRLFRLVGAFEASAGVSFLESSLVFFEEGDGEVRSASRDEFHQLSANGEVGPETKVFDVAVDTLAGLMNGGFHKRAADSWHKSLLAD
jgi:hypothetical protein